MASEAHHIRDLSSVLRTSFQAIKRDVHQLNERVEETQQKEDMLLHHFQELQRSLGSFSADFVTADKLNLVKISLGELKNKFKRLDTAEHAIRELQTLAVHEKNNEQAIASLRAELETRHTHWRNNLRTLTNHADAAFEKINKNLATVQTFNNKDIDKRLDVFRREHETRLHASVSVLDSAMKKSFADVDIRQQRFTDELTRVVRKSHAQELVRTINVEFNTLKEQFLTLGSETEELHEHLRGLQHRTRDVERIQTQFATIHANFENLRRSVLDDVHDVRDDLAKVAKKVKENIPPKELRSAARLLHLKTKTPRLLKTSNTFIGISFAFVLFAAILFFTLAPAQRYLVDWTIGLAVVVFVIGIIIRIVHAVKN